MDLTLYIPKPDELGFYQSMLSDPDTMSYNAPWFPPDGCIDFPRAKWAEWHAAWIDREPQRFYAYLRRMSDGAFVGDVNYHYDPDADQWEIGILILAAERGKGYGQQGLKLLTDHAFSCGIPALHNTFESTRTAALRMHEALGFRAERAEDGVVHLCLTQEAYAKRNA